jgi:iron complex transport system permease protein
VTAVSLQPTRLRPVWLAGALVVLAAAVLVGVLLGAAGLGWRGVLGELADRVPLVDVTSGLTDRQATILWELRLPRVVLGALVGGTLAIAGAAYQGVFRNPLADPYLLGAAAGAGLGATLVIAYGRALTGPIDPVPVAAFGGALAGVGLAYLVGRSVGGRSSAASLVLAGVAVAAFLTALQTFVQQRNSDTLREVYTWILGRLGTTGWSEVLLIAPYVAVSSAVILVHGRLLDVLSVGDEEAGALGVRTGRVRFWVVLGASLGTAAAVAVSGLIGFVGIIVPHIVRMVAGSSYRIVLPLSFLLGAAFLVFADVIARTVAAPAELPIGVVTAFFGAPFFAVVLRTSRGLGT